MESTVAHPAWWMQAYAWADARKKQLLYGAAAAVVVALVVSFYLYNRSERETAASEALSAAAAQAAVAKTEKHDGYLKVASQFAGTSAAGQALLHAGTAFYADGRYPEALAQFERFIREYRESPLLGQALFGVAACFDAQGKSAEAIERYRNLIDRRPNDNMIPQTKLNLARIYEGQNKADQAKTLYEDVGRSSAYGNAGSEAAMRLAALLSKHPELSITKASATNAAALNLLPR